MTVGTFEAFLGVGGGGIPLGGVWRTEKREHIYGSFKGVWADMEYSRLQQVGIWIEGDLCGFAFFLPSWHQRTVRFQLSGFDTTGLLLRNSILSYHNTDV